LASPPGHPLFHRVDPNHRGTETVAVQDWVQPHALSPLHAGPALLLV